MTTPVHWPRELPVDDAATWWSVPGPEVGAALAERPLVVLLHGLGADESDLAALVPLLPADLLYAAIRAPLPVSGTVGFGWFPPRGGQRVVPEPAAADAAARGVLRWLERTHARVRSAGPVALLGFSQGAATAVQALRHSPEALACVVALSGFVAGGLVAGDEAMAQIRPPVLWGHDSADPVVPTADAEHLRAFLLVHAAVVERRYPGTGHGIGATEVADVAAFLTAHLGGRPGAG